MSQDESIVISVRLPRKMVTKIDALAEKKKVDRSAILRTLLEKGLQQEMIDDILNALRKREMSVWKAAEELGISYREMLRIMKESNVLFPLGEDEIDLELRRISTQKGSK
ncbi:MAG: ribbon-helix-helix protein, CopG family [Candidatus Asgardarchaeia archaeon]|nr:ribbon-helix-helix protein, CopG family [Candidatus Odinarchaeota archaeon]